MQKARKREILVGLFVIFTFSVLLGMTFIIRGNTGVNPYVFQTEFPDVAGLEIGGPVLVSGFRLGRVTRMEPTRTATGEPAVIVTAKVARRIPIYRDATVKLAQQGFLGDKRLELTPGTPAAGEIARYEAIEGRAMPELTDMFGNASQMMEELSLTITSVRELVTDPDRVAEFDETLRNIRTATERLDAMLEENRQALGTVIANLEDVSTRAVSVAEKADRLVEQTDRQMDEIGGDVRAAIAELRDSSRDLTRRIDTVLVRADEAGANANELILSSREEVRQISASLQRTSDELNALLRSINEGEGTVGMLMKDPRPFQDLQEAITALRSVLMREQDRLYDRRIPYRQPPAAGTAETHGLDSGAN